MALLRHLQIMPPADVPRILDEYLQIQNHGNAFGFFRHVKGLLAARRGGGPPA